MFTELLEQWFCLVYSQSKTDDELENCAKGKK